MNKLLFIAAFPLLIACTEKGSEIGNPLDIKDRDTIETSRYFSTEEIEFIQRIGRLDQRKIDSLLNHRTAQVDSMFIKSFNGYYFGR